MNAISPAPAGHQGKSAVTAPGFRMETLSYAQPRVWPPARPAL